MNTVVASIPDAIKVALSFMSVVLVLITASFRVAARRGQPGGSARLVATADAALYRAKANGRDRVEAAGPAERELVAA